ncbi:MAG TPA: hypothetical protein VIF32_10305 [Gemmatimonadaceae bacterium]|jgi:hypothetical protein
MYKTVLGAVLIVGITSSLTAQQTRADSIAKARADSIALVRELERMSRDTSRAQAPTGTQQGPTNPRLLPDFSAVGDFVGDLSPNGSTQENLCRFCVREVELAVQAAVDPFFRGDVFLGISDLEKISIEQAFLTTTSLPYGLEVRLGRQLLPMGKINVTHRHDLHTVEYPWIVQKFLGADGMKGTGVYVSKILAPFGFYQELIVTANDRIGEAPEDLVTEEAHNKELGGLAYHARFRNYLDISESSNFELSASALTGKTEQPVDVTTAGLPAGITAVNARQSLIGGDLTFRWRPLEQGLYKSLILQAEFMRQFNERLTSPGFLGPGRDFNGAYTFARWQLTQRLYLGGRYDWVQDPELNGETFTAGSGYLEWFPSEFSKLMVGYERTMPTGLDAVNRVLLQASFALGPHKPHPF